ncbi:MAG: hypothetical protein JEY94_16025 [Melioribacteraceae bacterium]|nr:hypothetical protein [Melioribacteraceae bacterium]
MKFIPVLILTLVLLSASQLSAQTKQQLAGKQKNYIIATKYINKGNYHLKKKKYLWALQAYSKSLKQYPLAAAYTNMAIVYRKFGDTKKMLKCLKSAGHLGDGKAKRIWELHKRGF